MEQFKQAYTPDAEVQKSINVTMELWRACDADTRALFPNVTSEVEARKYVEEIVLDELENGELFINDKYQVARRRMGELIHLSIKRLDKSPERDWREIQEIKNQLVGPECEGVELYPAESRLVDTANQFHLWCAVDPKFRFPFGFNGGRIVTNSSYGNAVQRPR